MLGVQPADDITSLSLSDFQADDDRVATQRQHVAEAKRDGIWVGESEFVNRDACSIRVSIQILAHRSPEGSPAYLSIVARDVTELKEAQRERQLMEVQLRQSQKIEAIGQLAAGIAHEINTPIQYVGDNIQFLQESFDALRQILKNREELIQAAKRNDLTPELLVRAEEMSQAADLKYLSQQVPAAINQSLEGISRITKIVRAMKEFSHPGGQEKCASDLNHAIETTVTVARNEWKYIADVKLDLDPALPLVPCHIGEFNQAILNLIVNAAHAIGDVMKVHPDAKGSITVQTRRIGENVEIRVSDTGTGIPESVRPRIFEPFFTTKQVGKGTGQGLAVVYSSVVKKHGGSIHFESEVNKGTTFILTLPLSPAAPLA
jgi:signal transduction histidine kinase